MLLLSALAGTCACAWGCVIRVALELYKKSLTVMTIVQTPWFQRCSTTACAARADWTRALERGRETSGSQHPVAAHLPLFLLLPSVSFVRRKGFEHQSAAMLPWRQKQLVRDLVKGGMEGSSMILKKYIWALLRSKVSTVFQREALCMSYTFLKDRIFSVLLCDITIFFFHQQLCIYIFHYITIIKQTAAYRIAQMRQQTDNTFSCDKYILINTWVSQYLYSSLAWVQS